MKQIIVALALLVFTAMATAQQTSVFPELRRLPATLLDSAYTFGYDAKTTRIAGTWCYDLPKHHPRYCPGKGYENEKLLAVYANGAIKDSISILFTTGPSEDPAFIFSNRQGKTLAMIGALELYITADGWIYTCGHINNMYNQRRKFKLRQNGITEVPQPYQYVGLKSVTTDTLTLYGIKTGNATVARLPKGAAVEVLLCDTDKNKSQRYYLLRTAFGLVGWLRLESDGLLQTPVEGLYFAGD